MYICTFHVLKIFNRTITYENMKISIEEKDLSLNIIQDIVYSSSEEEYLIHYNKLLNTTPHTVSEYFTMNWHESREKRLCTWCVREILIIEPITDWNL